MRARTPLAPHLDLMVTAYWAACRAARGGSRVPLMDIWAPIPARSPEWRAVDRAVRAVAEGESLRDLRAWALAS